MSRLSNNAINDHMNEDHTCQGCDRDTLDCVCCEHHIEDNYFPDWEGFDDDPDFDQEPYDDVEDDHAAYLQAQWDYESDRFP